MDRVIVFCRFDSSDQGQAIGAPEYRLVDLFTACTPGMHTQERTPKNVKDCIIENFCKSGSNLRIVVATIAFGMGLNCADIRRIIHWGPPGDIESYLQETGRAGRDGLPSIATLYIGPHDLRSPHLEDSIKIYCKNTNTCRRDIIAQDIQNIKIYKTLPV